MKKKQTGVGLVEVLVALILLSIAVLGFVALQIRAIATSNEASNNIQAINIARDLAERMRMNRDGLAEYKAVASAPIQCASQFCSVDEMARYDYAQVKARAHSMGMNINVLNCQGTTLIRKCIYVAWEGTTATDGTSPTDCTNATAYIPNAKCIIMEVYNDV
ncbi:type IV pilus modification protein PilV [Acinetobacter nematophilus]|uniref:type IV pilus modification protein PilV n=1 Tax=Acinetobacter nematophilus TaxID=2994642 RepID=UPI003AF6096D